MNKPDLTDASFTFIRTINFGQQKLTDADGLRSVDKSEFKDIEIALPSEHGGSSLTVICGRNRTGKSHFLRHTYYGLGAHNANVGTVGYEAELGSASANVWVRPEDPTKSFSPYLLLANLSESARKFSTLPVLHASKIDRSNELRISSVRTSFIRDQLLTAPSLVQGIGRSIVDADLQEEALKRVFPLLKSDKLYRVNTNSCPPLQAFERMCNGKLYLRANKNFGFEPVLRFTREEATSYGSDGSGWSQGQKVAFVLALILYYLRPTILLIDELENHLHPEFISGLCDLIGQYAKQTIITTHHPHLIFSTHVNRAWFFEVKPVEDTPGLVEDMPQKHPHNRPPPKRRISDLSTDFQRVAAAYQLFDSVDKQLLNLGQSIRSDLAYQLLQAINSGLTLKVVSAGGGARADGQTGGLAEVIYNLTKVRETKELHVLDYGAGSGRTFLELAKVKKLDLTQLNWTFYEPNPHHSEQLKTRTWGNLHPNGLKVVTDINAVEPSFDVILAVNLLHECTPKDIYKFFQDCRRLLAKDGKVIIGELYPLLEPERFGIGYSFDDMLDIVSSCGFAGYSTNIPMRGGALTAYALIARPNQQVDEKAATDAIGSVIWGRIKSRHLMEYGELVESRRVRDVVKLASQLHAIASMEAYTHGSWRDFN